MVIISPSDDETRTESITYGRERRTLFINGQYRDRISSETMWAVVDGVKFTIRGVESDGQKSYTRLRIEVMSPNG